jgi:hypothetical protein
LKIELLLLIAAPLLKTAFSVNKYGGYVTSTEMNEPGINDPG